jgi:glycosyltransferase involved in cell wall biosynthesis
MTSRSRPSVSVVVCTLNEEENLPYVLPHIPAFVDEVIIVDGQSTDGTVTTARRLRADIRVVNQPGKGKGPALLHGIQEAKGEIVVTLDADGSTDPRELEHFLVPLAQGYDFVKGSRFKGGLPRNSAIRIVGNIGLTLIFDVLYGKTYTDICSGYNAFWKRTMGRVDLDIPGDFPAEPLFLVRVGRAGLRVKEIAHRDNGRFKGNPKVPVWLRHGTWILMAIVRERFGRKAAAARRG